MCSLAPRQIPGSCESHISFSWRRRLYAPREIREGPTANFLCKAAVSNVHSAALPSALKLDLQRYSAHKNPPPSSNLQQDYTWGPMVVLEGGGCFL